MPTVTQNLDYWTKYAWSKGGDEWSVAWGDSMNLWHGTILPRICGFLPAKHILEIAPGHGRCTQYLLPQCERITLVDLVPECIEVCRKRFGWRRGVKYYVNDGRSLAMVKDESINFVFSWDSLVHVEADVVRAYLAQLARKLKPGAMGFFHHSNIGSYSDGAGGLTVENPHWRAASMSAAVFRDSCHEFGLRCLGQEVIPWGGEVFNDCMSLFTKPVPSGGASQAVEAPLLENRHFWDEARWIRKIGELYRPPRE